MNDSDFLRTADRSKKDVAQGYADDEVNGGLIPVPEELNKCVYMSASFMLTCYIFFALYKTLFK